MGFYYTALLLMVYRKCFTSTFHCSVIYFFVSFKLVLRVLTFTLFVMLLILLIPLCVCYVCVYVCIYIYIYIYISDPRHRECSDLTKAGWA